jgi:polyisoprenyl-phosphate glycosyltransferase
MPTLALEALRRRLPPLVDPAVARDFVHVEDVVDAFLLAARAARSGEVYNVGTGTQTTIGELVRVVGEVFSFVPDPAWGSMPRRAWDTGTWIANPAKIRAELGWEPRRALGDGLRDLGDWLGGSPELRARYERGGARQPSD